MEQLKKGYKKTELGVIPEDWNFYKVNDLIESGVIEKPLDGNHGNIHPKRSDFVDYGIPFIMANNVYKGKLDLQDCYFITEAHARKLQKGFSFEGDVLITHKGTVGNTTIVPIISTPFIMLTPQVTYYRVKDVTKLNNRFLKCYFDFGSFQRILKNHSGGGTRAYIGIVKQKELPVILPPTLNEQKAIADALTEVDELITNLEKLIAKKKAIKQGAMQQLLTPPHKGGKRLDGFSGDWEEKTLGEVCNIKKGQLITESTRVNGEVPVIAGGKTPAYFHNMPNRIGKTITISGSGASAGYVSFHITPIFASDCSTIEENKDYSIEFLFYFLQLMQEEIYRMQTGGAQPHIHPSDLKPIKICLPKLNEQESIAQIIREMDIEIKVNIDKCKKIKLNKQGMMQELLTGKTRLI